MEIPDQLRPGDASCENYIWKMAEISQCKSKIHLLHPGGTGDDPYYTTISG